LGTRYAVLLRDLQPASLNIVLPLRHGVIIIFIIIIDID
jgi:hypothetical protein